MEAAPLTSSPGLGYVKPPDQGLAVLGPWEADLALDLISVLQPRRLTLMTRPPVPGSL